MHHLDLHIQSVPCDLETFKCLPKFACGFFTCYVMLDPNAALHAPYSCAHHDITIYFS